MAERLFCDWYCWHFLNRPMMRNIAPSLSIAIPFFCLLTNSHSKWKETNLSKLSLLSSTFQKSSIRKIPKQNWTQKTADYNELTKTPIIATCCIVWYLPRADSSQNCVPARLFVRGSIHFQQLAQPGNNAIYWRLKSPTKKTLRNLWLTCNYVKNWPLGNKPLQKKQGGKIALHLLFGWSLDKDKKVWINPNNSHESLDRSKLRPSQTPTNHPSEFFGHITFSVPNIKL